MFGWLKKGSVDKEAVRRWRDAVTANARLPEPYLKGWVPDTIYGRFNMVAVVATFAMRRLRACGADGREISKAFAEMLFSDFDHALRENGVGDASIARRIRKMGEEFYGLAKAMDEALDADAPQKAIAAVLQRNVQPNHENAMALADYILPISEQVDALSDEAALAGPDAI
mmetsp:Transcript_32185/g.41414  ORF Transcript_32185/g.41414 Transcript_32185/m.41414 type:complete len:171 (+) Transcript_32185:74-586(+)